MSPKPPLMFKRPTASSVVDESKLRELEERAEARGNGVAGQPVSADAASSQARNTATPQAREGGANTARSGTAAEPYTRKDGQATRSTTVHLPVDIHHRLRMVAADRGVHMSAIVTEAVGEWLASRDG